MTHRLVAVDNAHVFETSRFWKLLFDLTGRIADFPQSRLIIAHDLPISIAIRVESSPLRTRRATAIRCSGHRTTLAKQVAERNRIGRRPGSRLVRAAGSISKKSGQSFKSSTDRQRHAAQLAKALANAEHGRHVEAQSQLRRSLDRLVAADQLVQAAGAIVRTPIGGISDFRS